MLKSLELQLYREAPIDDGLEAMKISQGLKAMVELNRLNPHPGAATDSMVLFLS